MARISVTIEGVDRLLKKAGNLEPEMRKGVNRALAAGALRINADAKRFAPVDTGRLRASIDFDVDPTELEASVGTNVVYAKYVEFGTSRQRAQPFLFPAFEANRVQIVREIAAALGAALD